MRISDTQIHLKGIRLYAYHGVLEQERRVGAWFTVNLTLDVDYAEASLTDELAYTISYAQVYDVIKAVMEKPALLLERVVWCIAISLFESFPQLTRVHIELYKENPPMGGEITDVGVSATFFSN